MAEQRAGARAGARDRAGAGAAAPVPCLGHDFASNWERVADWHSICIEARGVAISVCRLDTVVAVNGDLRAALDDADIELPPVGWPDVAYGESYAVRLARDRALIVGGEPLARGWHDRGYAVSRSEDASIVFCIAGPGTLEFLSLGAAVFVACPSATAVRIFAGLHAILYRHGSESAVRVHVARPRAAALLKWLRISADHASPKGIGQ